MSAEQKTSTLGQYEIDLVPNEHGGYYARVPDFPRIFIRWPHTGRGDEERSRAVELMLEEHRDGDFRSRARWFPSAVSSTCEYLGLCIASLYGGPKSRGSG